MEDPMVEFISDIEAQPAIWNAACEDYSNKLTKKSAWEKIMCKHSQDFKKKTAAEKKNIASHFQRKWKSLRDSYTRELARRKKEKAGVASAAGRKEYIYYHRLSFLEIAVKSSTTPSSIEGEEKEDQDEEQASCLPPEGGETKQEEKEVNNYSQKGGYPKKRTTVMRKELAEEERVLRARKKKFLKAQPSKGMEKEEDELFMMSLVPEFKRIPDHMKLDVKCELLNVFKRARSCQANHISFPSVSNIPPNMYVIEAQDPIESVSQPSTSCSDSRTTSYHVLSPVQSQYSSASSDSSFIEF